MSCNHSPKSSPGGNGHVDSTAALDRQKQHYQQQQNANTASEKSPLLSLDQPDHSAEDQGSQTGTKNDEIEVTHFQLSLSTAPKASLISPTAANSNAATPTDSITQASLPTASVRCNNPYNYTPAQKSINVHASTTSSRDASRCESRRDSVGPSRIPYGSAGESPAKRVTTNNKDNNSVRSATNGVANVRAAYVLTGVTVNNVCDADDSITKETSSYTREANYLPDGDNPLAVPKTPSSMKAKKKKPTNPLEADDDDDEDIGKHPKFFAFSRDVDGNSRNENNNQFVASAMLGPGSSASSLHYRNPPTQSQHLHMSKGCADAANNAAESRGAVRGTPVEGRVSRALDNSSIHSQSYSATSTPNVSNVVSVGMNRINSHTHGVNGGSRVSSGLAQLSFGRGHNHQQSFADSIDSLAHSNGNNIGGTSNPLQLVGPADDSDHHPAFRHGAEDYQHDQYRQHEYQLHHPQYQPAAYLPLPLVQVTGDESFSRAERSPSALRYSRDGVKIEYDAAEHNEKNHDMQQPYRFSQEIHGYHHRDYNNHFHQHHAQSIRTGQSYPRHMSEYAQDSNPLAPGQGRFHQQTPNNHHSPPNNTVQSNSTGRESAHSSNYGSQNLTFNTTRLLPKGLLSLENTPNVNVEINQQQQLSQNQGRPRGSSRHTQQPPSPSGHRGPHDHSNDGDGALPSVDSTENLANSDHSSLHHQHNAVYSKKPPHSNEYGASREMQKVPKLPQHQRHQRSELKLNEMSDLQFTLEQPLSSSFMTDNVSGRVHTQQHHPLAVSGAAHSLYAHQHHPAATVTNVKPPPLKTHLKNTHYDKHATMNSNIPSPMFSTDNNSLGRNLDTVQQGSDPVNAEGNDHYLQQRSKAAERESGGGNNTATAVEELNSNGYHNYGSNNVDDKQRNAMMIPFTADELRVKVDGAIAEKNMTQQAQMPVVVDVSIGVPGYVFSVYNADSTLHYQVNSEDIRITKGSIKYVEHHSRYGQQTRYRFQLCGNYLQGKCLKMSDCPYIHADRGKLNEPTAVHLNYWIDDDVNVIAQSDRNGDRKLNPDGSPQTRKGGSGFQNVLAENKDSVPCLPEGHVLYLYRPNALTSNPAEKLQAVPSHLILETVGSQTAISIQVHNKLPEGTSHPNENGEESEAIPRAKHCAHFQFKRLCNMGPACHFIHAKVACTDRDSTGTAAAVATEEALARGAIRGDPNNYYTLHQQHQQQQQQQPEGTAGSPSQQARGRGGREVRAQPQPPTPGIIPATSNATHYTGIQHPAPLQTAYLVPEASTTHAVPSPYAVHPTPAAYYTPPTALPSPYAVEPHAAYPHHQPTTSPHHIHSHTVPSAYAHHHVHHHAHHYHHAPATHFYSAIPPSPSTGGLDAHLAHYHAAPPSFQYYSPHPGTVSVPPVPVPPTQSHVQYYVPSAAHTPAQYAHPAHAHHHHHHPASPAHLAATPPSASQLNRAHHHVPGHYATAVTAPVQPSHYPHGSGVNQPTSNHFISSAPPVTTGQQQPPYGPNGAVDPYRHHPQTAQLPQTSSPSYAAQPGAPTHYSRYASQNSVATSTTATPLNVTAAISPSYAKRAVNSGGNRGYQAHATQHPSTAAYYASTQR